MISKQAALDILDDFEKDIENGVNSYGEYRDRLWSLSERLEWIPCSERLPKEGERILVTAALEHVMVAHYGKMFFEKERGNVFYLAGEDGDADITDVVVAWMPLPEPYREEGDQ